MHTPTGYHHHAKKKQTKPESTIDKLVYLAGFVGPITALPQLHVLFKAQNSEHISLVTRACGCIIALIRLAYGIHHKNRPLIFSNTLRIIIGGAMVYGIVLYR